MGNILVFVAAIAWSTAGIFTRIISTDFPTTLFWRSLTGGFSVLLIYFLVSTPPERRRLLLLTKGELIIAVLITAGMLCFIASFFYTTVANVSFIYGVMPLSTLVLSVIILKEKADSTALVCCVLSMFGVIFIMWGVKDLNDKLGLLLAFGMTFFMASITIATKYYPSAEVAKSTYLSAFLCALIVYPFSSPVEMFSHDYFWLSIYGITNVGLGFGVYLLGVSRTTATSAALIGLTEIPLAPLLAWVLFSEKIDTHTLIGGSVIMLATLLYLTRSAQYKDCRSRS